jgi:hypothetical protein
VGVLQVNSDSLALVGGVTHGFGILVKSAISGKKSLTDIVQKPIITSDFAILSIIIN